MNTPNIITLRQLRDHPAQFVSNAQDGVVITRHGRFIAIASRVETIDQARTLATQLVEEDICEPVITEWQMTLDEFMGYVPSNLGHVFTMSQLVLIEVEGGIIAVMPFIQGVEGILLSRMSQEELGINHTYGPGEFKTVDELIVELDLDM